MNESSNLLNSLNLRVSKRKMSSETESKPVVVDPYLNPLEFYQMVKDIVECEDYYGCYKGYNRGFRVNYRPFKYLDKILQSIPSISPKTQYVTQNPKIFVDLGNSRAMCLQDPSHLSVDEIQALVSAGSPAPFGKGTETVLDSTVRSAVEIPGDRILISDFLNHDIIKEALDVDSNVCLSLRLYKMHIYPDGGHFDEHLDTLHSENHVATLVLGLGSDYIGGELEINGIKHNLHPDDKQNLAYVTFYTDTKHKVHPVTNGTRIVLQYDVFFEFTDSSVPDPEEIDIEDDQDYCYKFTQISHKVPQESHEVSEVPDEKKDQAYQESFSILRHEVCRILKTDAPALGIFCKNMYPLGALGKHSLLLKGFDRKIYEALSCFFNVRLQGLMIFKEKQDDMTECKSPTVHTVDISELLYKQEDPKQAHKRQRGSTENTTPDADFVLSWDMNPENVSGFEVSESPFIEHTGNECQFGHLLYHSVCFVISEKCS